MAMKNFLKPAVVLIMLAPVSMVSIAEEQMSGMQHGKNSNQGMNMDQGSNPGMGQGMGQGSGQGMGMMGGMSEEKKDMHMRSMQAHMLQMHDLSDQILAEKDPKKKQQLKDTQLELMKAHMSQMMKMMKGMGQNPKHKQMMQKGSMGNK